MPYQGYCLCGGCKVFVDAEPARNGLALCHCKDCQHNSGTAFSAVAAVPTESVRAEGSVKLYEYSNPLSGNTVSRWFCADCGSQLISRSSNHPERTGIKVGNVEEFTKLPILFEIFAKDRWPSIPPIPGAFQFTDGVDGVKSESEQEQE